MRHKVQSLFQMEALRRENKMLTQELKDLTGQLGEGGKSMHELQKCKRRLEMERDELQARNCPLYTKIQKLLFWKAILS